MILFFALLDFFALVVRKSNRRSYFHFLRILIKNIFLNEGGSGYVAGTP